MRLAVLQISFWVFTAALSPVLAAESAHNGNDSQESPATATTPEALIKEQIEELGKDPVKDEELSLAQLAVIKEELEKTIAKDPEDKETKEKLEKADELILAKQRALSSMIGKGEPATSTPATQSDATPTSSASKTPVSSRPAPIANAPAVSTSTPKFNDAVTNFSNLIKEDSIKSNLSAGLQILPTNPTKSTPPAANNLKSEISNSGSSSGASQPREEPTMTQRVVTAVREAKDWAVETFNKTFFDKPTTTQPDVELASVTNRPVAETKTSVPAASVSEASSNYDSNSNWSSSSLSSSSFEANSELAPVVNSLVVGVSASPTEVDSFVPTPSNSSDELPEISFLNDADERIAELSVAETAPVETLDVAAVVQGGAYATPEATVKAVERASASSDKRLADRGNTSLFRLKPTTTESADKPVGSLAEMLSLVTALPEE